MIPPGKLKINSDQNELKYKDTIKPVGNKSQFYVYEYTKSHTKKGSLIGWTEPELTKMLIEKIIIPL